MLILAAAARLLFRCSELVFHRSERSLSCDFWTYYIIIEMLYWNNYICLMIINGYDELMSDVCNSAPTYLYTCDIANESLDFDMTPGYWVICE